LQCSETGSAQVVREEEDFALRVGFQETRVEG